MMKCDICNSKKLNKIKLEYFSIFMCQKCGFGRLAEVPSVEDAGKIYKSDYFKGKNEKDHIQDSLKKCAYVKKFLPNGSNILDFGCGTGNFLLAAKSENYELVGYDISKSAVKTAKEKTGIKGVFSSTTKEMFKDNSLDCIVCFDVIEHLPDYKNKLLLFKRWLKKGGYLFITTPNSKSWDALLMGKNWYGFRKYPEHVVYFSPKSITKVLGESGFEVKKIRLWGFIRSFNFVLENGIKNRHIRVYGIKVLNFLNLKSKHLYMPMTDMMVVAIKKQVN